MELGLMPAIEALVGEWKKEGGNGTERHPYFRRPGRGHNRDTCDACGECGDILCCDTCPASFHWACADPPLEEDEIPTGVWQCRNCKATKVKTMEATQVPDSVAPSTPDMESSADKVVTLRAAFAELISAAQLMNPRQFVLPPDYPCYDYALPGSARPKKRGPTKGKPTNPPSNNVTRERAFCFTCSVSARAQPLLKCDSCPSHFHLDCLDPPLTTFPSGIWLCPLHPDHVLEAKTLRSSFLSERLRIWEETHRPVDHFSTTLKFLTKIHRSGTELVAPKRRPGQGTVKVPGAVKQSYSDSRDHGAASLLQPSSGSGQDFVPEPRGTTSLDILATAAAIRLRKEESKEQVPVSEPVDRKSHSEERADTLEEPEPTLTLLCLNKAVKLEFYARSISVGRSSEAVLDVTELGACGRVAGRHAVIYYDEVCQRWELLSYGATGTLVNNLLYGCKIGRVREEKAPCPAHESVLKEIRDIVEKKRGVLTLKNPNVKLNSGPGMDSVGQDCGCVRKKALSAQNKAWEGPAGLQTGDRIQLGCVKLLVMSV